VVSETTALWRLRRNEIRNYLPIQPMKSLAGFFKKSIRFEVCAVSIPGNGIRYRESHPSQLLNALLEKPPPRWRLAEALDENDFIRRE